MKLPSHFVTNATTVASDFTMTRSESLANFGKTLSTLAITLTLSLGLTGCEYFQTQTDANSPIGAKQIAKLIPKRPKNANKTDFGHVLVVGGARRMEGAAVLSATAAAR